MPTANGDSPAMIKFDWDDAGSEGKLIMPPTRPGCLMNYSKTTKNGDLLGKARDGLRHVELLSHEEI